MILLSDQYHYYHYYCYCYYYYYTSHTNNLALRLVKIKSRDDHWWEKKSSLHCVDSKQIITVSEGEGEGTKYHFRSEAEER